MTAAVAARRWLGGRRARCESVLQLEAAECGAASLAMILSHFGRRAPLEELRLACGVSRDGSKASGILKAARAYGLAARGLKAEPEHLAELPMPAIAFVNFNHFLVVEGVGRGVVWLNDPANGPRTVTEDEFDEMFTGVVLTFERGDGFEARDDRPRLLDSLARRLASAKGAVAFAVLASLVLVLPGLALPIFSRVFVDFVLAPKMSDWLGPLVLGMLATALVRAALTGLRFRYLLAAETRLAIEGSRAMLWRMLRLPTSFFDQRFAGEIADRLNLNDGLARLLTGELARALLSLAMIGLFFLAMCSYSVPLALVAAALTTLNLVVVMAIARGIRDGYRKVSLEQGKLFATTVAGLQDIETYKAAGAEDAFFGRWAGLQVNVIDAEQRIALPLAMLSAVPTFLNGLSIAAVVGLGGLLIADGEMTIGMLVAFQTLMASFTQPAAELANLGGQMQQVQAFTARLDDIEGQPLDRRFGGDGDKLQLDALPRGHLELRDVAFGYNPLEPPLIENFSLSATAGARIALVGASGSGKSTIGRLIVGLHRPREGQVLIDGRPFDAWPPAALAARLAYVDQDVTLFEGTVRDNLTLWDTTVPEADIVAAARDAQVHDVIAARPGAYEARVEENGRNLSGGQRQRLDIARALARNPSIIVLDEATSALDPEMELAVMDAIRRRGATCIVIAHRLSTIRDCDEIIVMERGQIVERGHHAALIEAGGRYAGLLEN